MALTGGYCSAVPAQSALLKEDVNISKVAALNIRNESNIPFVFSFFITFSLSFIFKEALVLKFEEEIDINMQLDLSLLYEVQLFCMVPFLVENISLEELHWLEICH